MLEILKLFNFTLPNFNITNEKPISPPSSKVLFETRELKSGQYMLYLKGERWMMYDYNTHLQASQLFSHYYIASGDVITTGLGLAIRENWLLNNSKIKSLTIIEKSPEVIEYHKKYNNILFQKSKIINCDAREYKGKCDTLLLDHYESETMSDIISDVRFICSNIECEKMWFWHLETQIIADLHNWYEKDIWELFRKGEFRFDVNNFKNIENIYNSIKLKYELNKLPKLTKSELILILTIYTNFFQEM
jgi:hypothetical protein